MIGRTKALEVYLRLKFTDYNDMFFFIYKNELFCYDKSWVNERDKTIKKYEQWLIEGKVGISTRLVNELSDKAIHHIHKLSLQKHAQHPQ